MKFINKTSLSMILICIIGYLSMFNSSGSYTSNGGRTGASFDNGTCSNGTSCHSSSGSFSPTTTLQLFDGSTAVTSYTANHSYTLRITISSSGTNSNTKYGFQAVSVKSSNNSNVSGWGTMPSGTKTVTISGRTYASHSTRLTSGVINIPWTSPVTSTGNITFYAAGLVADGNFQQTNDNVATSSLTISASTGSGCTKPTTTPNITHVKCFGDNTGAINITTSGGSSPFSFDWTGPSSFSSTAQNISYVKAGQYRLIITATGGCKDTIYPIINQPASKISLTKSSDAAFCIGDNIPLTASATGGTGTLAYTWLGPLSFTSNSKTPAISPAMVNHTGKYSITVTDANNCIATDTVNIQVDSLPMIDQMIVQKVAENTFKFSMDNPRYVDNQQWIFGDGLNNSNATITHTYTSKGAFVAKLIISNHCGSDTFMSNILNWPTNIYTLKDSKEPIKVYPNPCDKSATITISNDDTVNDILIMSIEGILVYKKRALPNSSFTINTRSYPSGLYLVHLKSTSSYYIHLIKVIH
ncbi:MAG: choice-of-anchor V domain-containing protein [Flavipsychrobacter sp.]